MSIDATNAKTRREAMHSVYCKHSTTQWKGRNEQLETWRCIALDFRKK